MLSLGEKFFRLLELGRPFIIGMIHVGPLPGSPRYEGERLNDIITEAVRNAKRLVEGGIDGILIEDFYDFPYPKEEADPAVVASMALIAKSVEEVANVPIGINMLRNCALASAAVASVVGGSFIRVNALSETIVSDQGIIEPTAYRLSKYFKYINYRPAVLADVHVKHASPLGRRSIGEVALDTVERGCADAVVISGERTGKPPEINDIIKVKKTLKEAPIIVGSGLTPENAKKLLKLAHGAIVGTYFKEGRMISFNKVRKLMGVVKELKLKGI